MACLTRVSALTHIIPVDWDAEEGTEHVTNVDFSLKSLFFL